MILPIPPLLRRLIRFTLEMLIIVIDITVLIIFILKLMEGKL